MPDQKDARQQHISDMPVTSVLEAGQTIYDSENLNHSFDDDEEVLAALGYKAEFKREFSLLTTFAVSFAVLGLLPSFASTLFYGMGYAGTAGLSGDGDYAALESDNDRYDLGMARGDGRTPVHCPWVG